MKILAAVLTLLFSAGLMQAQTAPAAPTTETKAPAPTTKAAPAKKEEKKPAELPKIPGQVITRANGDLLGLEVSGGNFKLTFYDKKHKPMPMDVTRAAARWPNVRGAGDNRTVLNGSGSVLVGSKPVIPPFVFNVYLTLLKGDGDEAVAVENYVVPFRG